MVKGLVVKVLQDNLGDYIDGLTPENFEMQIFGGSITLENVGLKREGMDSLNLPITINSGFVQRLSVQIPWSNLSSKPVVVTIEDVFVVATPKDPDQSREAIAKLVKARMEAKMKEISTRDVLRRAANSRGPGDPTGPLGTPSRTPGTLSGLAKMR
jgi:vacuolar protein sorting-associated protein 13A/C